MSVMDYGKGLMLITSGDRLPRSLAAALAAGGLRCTRSSLAAREAGQPRLLYTRGARLPRGRGERGSPAPLRR